MTLSEKTLDIPEHSKINKTTIVGLTYGLSAVVPGYLASIIMSRKASHLEARLFAALALAMERCMKGTPAAGL